MTSVPPDQTIPVREAHRLDEAALSSWLDDALPDLGQGALLLRQFQGGQSNPTYLVSRGGRQVVLRKKPPGVLLPKAHDVAREYRLLGALQDTAVPVPRTFAFCGDPKVLGAEFYVMEHVEGRIFAHPRMQGLTAPERRAAHLGAVDALSILHALDPDAVGLGDFGPRGGFVARQVKRWSAQYHSAREAGGVIEALDWLSDWLRERQNLPERTVLVHSDYRHGNLCYAPEGTELRAIFDWELTTLGAPMSDLAYLCMPYHIDASDTQARGVMGLDLNAEGIPPEAEVLERYGPRDGEAEAWPVYLALSFFRLSAILHGVMARANAGNAADGSAKEVGARAGHLAHIGREIARAAKG